MASLFTKSPLLVLICFIGFGSFRVIDTPDDISGYLEKLNKDSAAKMFEYDLILNEMSGTIGRHTRFSSPVIKGSLKLEFFGKDTSFTYIVDESTLENQQKSGKPIKIASPIERAKLKYVEVTFTGASGHTQLVLDKVVMREFELQPIRFKTNGQCADFHYETLQSGEAVRKPMEPCAF
ncbi:hypothetical protein HDE_10054 [Halotydeus destructor]|nr:hypothetical protein HDE_10054 [Halotydeus destructor]